MRPFQGRIISRSSNLYTFISLRINLKYFCDPIRCEDIRPIRGRTKYPTEIYTHLIPLGLRKFSCVKTDLEEVKCIIENLVKPMRVDPEGVACDHIRILISTQI
jgi:hypothetical protein